jgi:hypothetical protein
MIMKWMGMCQSVGLLGDQIVELLLRNHTITVSVGSLDHLLKHSIVSKLTEVLGHLSQVLKSDESCISKPVPVFWESKVMNTL